MSPHFEYPWWAVVILAPMVAAARVAEMVSDTAQRLRDAIVRRKPKKQTPQADTTGAPVAHNHRTVMCPNCGGGNVGFTLFEQLEQGRAVSATRQWSCHDCGHGWPEDVTEHQEHGHV